MANPSRQGGNGFPHAQSGPGGSGYAPHQHQNQPPNFVTQASSSSAEGGYHHLPQTPRSATADYNSAYYHTPTSGGMASGVPSSYGPPGYGPPGAGAGGNEDDDNDEAHPHANAAALGNYNAAAIMYNVAQTGAAAPESLYGGQPQFGAGPSRHHAASTMQMIPEVAYMDVSGNHPPASSAGHGIYHQNPSLGGYTEAVATMPHAGAAVTDEADYSASGGAGGDSGDLENNWYGYQQQLVTVYDDITEGSLEDASETLLGISEWLLPHVADLGLTTDDPSLHKERLQLWNDFNHAWLALGQRQLELIQSRADQSSGLQQRPLSRDKLESLGDRLVDFCDNIERHGLVDYQYGVWEDQIVSLFEKCLDLYESD